MHILYGVSKHYERKFYEFFDAYSPGHILGRCSKRHYFNVELS